jgi:hypothetical protein
MAESKQREAWGRTSSLLAMIANITRALAGRKSDKAFVPSDFDPFSARQQMPPLPGDVSMLKDVFIKHKEE